MAYRDVRLRVGVCLVTALCLRVSPTLLAQDDVGFRLPVEVFQGAAIKAPGVITPFQASLAVLPSWSFDPARLGVKLSLDYDNPSWKARFGVGLSSRVVSAFRNDIGLIVGGEATTTTDGKWRYAASVIFDVDGLIRMGISSGWQEAHAGAWFVGLTLGADPTRWFSCAKDDFTGKCLGAGGGKGPALQSDPRRVRR